MRRLALIGLLVALAAPADALAHASVRSTFPAYRERVEAAPRQVQLRFDQVVKALPDSVVVLDADGRRRSGTTTSEHTTVSVPVRPLPRGAYTVRWHVISGDGHVVSGVYTFATKGTSFADVQRVAFHAAEQSAKNLGVDKKKGGGTGFTA